ncbi:MAG: VWA domain-containing protein [Acidobacteriaceae bacterium]|nr:VWA domain-containing protein [Acidobacteriaceae bacterium]
MQFGSKTRVAGTLAIAAMTAATGLAMVRPQQQDQKQQPASSTSSTSEQSLPDGPKPQTLPSMDPLVPTAPYIAPPADTTTKASTTDPNAVPSSLPDTPAPTQAAQQTQDEGPAPELPAPGTADLAMTPLRVHVNFVEIPFTVKDSHGEPVPGITWRDVRVYENNVQQHMSVFTTDPFPISVALVIDQSVTFDTMEKINASLSALQGAFTPYDEISVFTYASSVKKQTDFTAAQSARLGVVLDRSKGKGRDPIMPLGGPIAQTTNINNHGVDPNTDSYATKHGFDKPEREFHPLNDAILAAAQELSTAGRGRRRIIFVISDGKEYGSVAKAKDVIKYLQTNKIAVYATLVGDASIPGMGFLDRIHLPTTMRDDALPRYAAATGGQCDPEFRPKGIEQSFAKIAETVRTQYTVGYYSHEPVLDGKFRKVEVRVMKPNLTVIAKDGYYPSPEDQRPQTSH